MARPAYFSRALVFAVALAAAACRGSGIDLQVSTLGQGGAQPSFFVAIDKDGNRYIAATAPLAEHDKRPALSSVAKVQPGQKRPTWAVPVYGPASVIGGIALDAGRNHVVIAGTFRNEISISDGKTTEKASLADGGVGVFVAALDVDGKPLFVRTIARAEATSGTS